MQNDGSKNFDDIFKNKLNGLSADSNPSDWIMMERLLEMEGLTQDNEATDETRFDEVALDKLSGIATGAFTPDWDRMSGLIDEMNEDPSMEPSEFDQAIDNKIKATSVGLDMAPWNRLEPILDRDRAAVVQNLDEIAKEKLTSISEVQSSWGTMNSKINRELFLPESIVKYKVIEVALILLFAFSAAQLPVQKIAEQIATAESPNTIAIQKEIIAGVESTPAESNTAISELRNIERLPETSLLESSSPIPSEIVDEYRPSDVDAVVLANSDESISTESPATPTEAIWDLPPTIVDLLDQYVAKPGFRFTSEAYMYLFQPTDIEGYDRSMAFLALYDQQLVENVFGNTTGEYKSVNRIFNVLDVAGVPTLAQELLPSQLISFEPSDMYSNNSGLILSVFTGSDYNEIVTPFDPIYAKEGTQQWNVGYAGGLALGMRFKNWELETGAIYSSNQYSPRKLYEITSGNISSGYIASTLRDIELEIVKIPLNFRFNVNLWDKWKVYALSGATMNMVVQSEFITDDVFINKGSFTTPANAAAPTTSGLARKDFGEGLLEGGSFKNNSFFTANLGLGVERTLNNKWSVFAQPTYQRQIFSNGIGPNQDRYNAISLFLGTRVSLSKKIKK